MLLDDVQKLKLGVYRIHWKSGGTSVASVGMMFDGTRWMAPSNWTSSDNDRPFIASTQRWANVERVELITTA